MRRQSNAERGAAIVAKEKSLGASGKGTYSVLHRYTPKGGK